jgi:Zn ribbon nucleic-acid-binding protein
MRIAAQVLRKFRAKRMHIGNLLVVDRGDYETNLIGRNYSYPVVTFEATALAEGNRCPACGAKDWWFLSGEDISTANCGCCGAFYKINEKEALEEG